MASSCLPVLALSLLVGAASVVACGGELVDPIAKPDNGNTTPPTGNSPASPPVTDPPAPNTPELPVNGSTIVLDPAKPAMTPMPRTSKDHVEKCELRIGGGIQAQSEQAAYETAVAGHRRLAGGTLLGEHRYNGILGVIGQKVFLASYSAIAGQFTFGITTVDLVSGAVAEVAPLTKELVGLPNFVSFGSGLYGVHEQELVRVTESGMESLRTVGDGSVLHRNDAGLFLVEATSIWRVSSTGLALIGSSFPLGTASAFDVHANGTVFYAIDEKLYRSDSPDTPIVQAPGRIVSVRIDTLSGDVAFTTARNAPSLSSLYTLRGNGVWHLAQTSKHQSQSTELPMRILDATGGQITVATTCSNDEDLPDEMPVRFDASFGSPTYIVDDPAYPYVKESAWLFGHFWQESMSGLRFFVGR
jgi:hypothetical protein